MNLNHKLRCAVSMLLSMGLLMGTVAQAQTPPNAPSRPPESAQDVVLLRNHVLLGQLVDAYGRPGASQEISIRQNNREIVNNQTTPDGRFAVSGLRSGVYQIATPTTINTVRLWQEDVAPPIADSEVVIVCEGAATAAAVAGPAPRASWVGILGNPWVLGGIAVGAVAIPVALDSDDDQRQPEHDLPEAS